MATKTAIGATPSRLRSMAAQGSSAAFTACTSASLGSVLVPWLITTPWLIAFSGVIFAASIASQWRRNATRLELALETKPHAIVVRNPWRTHRHAIADVAAIQAWCDCVPMLLPELGPHLDVVEIVSHDGTTVRVTPTTAFAPEVMISWREWLEPLGVKVVDWRAD